MCLLRATKNDKLLKMIEPLVNILESHTSLRAKHFSGCLVNIRLITFFLCQYILFMHIINHVATPQKIVADDFLLNPGFQLKVTRLNA